MRIKFEDSLKKLPGSKEVNTEIVKMLLDDATCLPAFIVFLNNPKDPVKL